MAEWNRDKVNSSDLNNGNEYDKDSQVALQELNGMVNAGLYAQDFAEHLADTPDTSEANNVGTPSVKLVDNVSNGIVYKKFKFSNLKGEKGDKGDKGDTGLPGGSNPSLLINGDFSINQRGQEEYGNATQYTVDRWQLLTRTNANISFNSISKTLSNTGTTEGYFIQRIEPNDVDKIWGKTWTFSAKVNGVVYSQTFTAPNNAPTSSQDIAPTLVCVQNICNVRLFYYANNGTLGFTFDIWQGSVTIEYAKLELGSVATPFSPRPHTEELALCQRYYQKCSPSNSYAMLGTGIVFSSSVIVIGVSLPVTLRTNPTITANGGFYVKTTSTTYTTNDNALTLSNAGLFNNVLQLEIRSTNTIFTNGDCAVLRVSKNTAYLSFDAELY